MLPASYALRNVIARPARSLLSMSVIALVVVACTLFLGLLSSLRRTVVSSGDPANLVVLRKGSNNDGSSQITLEAYQMLKWLDGIATSADGLPLASPELVVQPFFRTREGGRENVLVRGVEPVALEVHREVRVIEGRFFRPRLGEAVVGKGVRGRYAGAEIGDEIRFGRGRWTVVGVLGSDGSTFESEVWVDAQDLSADSRRLAPYSGVRLRTRSPADLVALKARIDGDPRYALEASPEPEYYTQQSESATTLYVLVIAVAVLAGTGAGFGAANSMYAAVQARTAEIGTLRALGFSRGAILLSFELESLVLSLAGWGVGALASQALVVVLRELLGGIAFGAQTFTTNVVTLAISGGDLARTAALALVIGVVGGLGPAWRAASLRPIEALRRA